MDLEQIHLICFPSFILSQNKRSSIIRKWKGVRKYSGHIFRTRPKRSLLLYRGSQSYALSEMRAVELGPWRPLRQIACVVLLMQFSHGIRICIFVSLAPSPLCRHMNINLVFNGILICETLRNRKHS